MYDLGVALRDHARRFQEQESVGVPTRLRIAVEEGIERLIAWSATNAAYLEDRGPEGVEPAFGVVPSGGIATVWRIYPRSGGGKVTLLVNVEQHLTQPERRTVVRVLERLQPAMRIGHGQRLEIGLARIAPAAQWKQFAPLLDLALDVAKRHGFADPAA